MHLSYSIDTVMSCSDFFKFVARHRNSLSTLQLSLSKLCCYCKLLKPSRIFCYSPVYHRIRLLLSKCMQNREILAGLDRDSAFWWWFSMCSPTCRYPVVSILKQCASVYLCVWMDEVVDESFKNYFCSHPHSSAHFLHMLICISAQVAWGNVHFNNLGSLLQIS